LSIFIQFNQQLSRRYAEAEILPKGDKDKEEGCLETGM
jgi:hypothetical protein